MTVMLIRKMTREVHFIDIQRCVLKLTVITLNSILISATKLCVSACMTIFIFNIQLMVNP